MRVQVYEGNGKKPQTPAEIVEEHLIWETKSKNPNLSWNGMYRGKEVDVHLTKTKRVPWSAWHDNSLLGDFADRSSAYLCLIDYLECLEGAGMEE